MGDSDDDCNTWRSRDKYPKERETSPVVETRNEKRPFNNYQNNEPPQKRFRRDNDQPTPLAREESAVNYPTQPMMLQFKSFLQQQDDDIDVDDAMKKYTEYKNNFVKKQLKAFFEAHNSQEWFREKYLNIMMEKRRQVVNDNVLKRKDMFELLNEKSLMDNLKLDLESSEDIIKLMDAFVILLEGGNDHDLKILESRRYRSESPNQSPKKDDLDVKKVEETENDDQQNEVAVDENGEKSNDDKSDTKIDDEKKTDEPRPLHKTFSIFLRNLHPNVLRSEIEALVKSNDGFLRLALQDPTPDRKFFRRGWVTFDCSVNIKEICWNLNNIRLNDCDIGAIVNRELTQRVRPVSVLTKHVPVMKQDVKVAAKLVAKFDKRLNLWQTTADMDSTNPLGSCNPLLKDITEYLVDEGSYEEEALLGGNLNSNLELNSSGDPSNISIDTDDKLTQILDKLIVYLRFVHSFDYYSTTEYQMEDEMPHRCGIMHVRGLSTSSDKPISQKDVEDYIKSVETKSEPLLNSVDTLSEEEAKKIGYKLPDEAVEEFISENTQQLGEDKWLCPLSGKKFKGPEFVRKHIQNKHGERLDEVRANTEYFNNYLMDPKRPQLPEHPGNKAGAAGNTNNKEEGQMEYGGYRNNNRNQYDNNYSRGGYRNNDFNERRFNRNSPTGSGGGYNRNGNNYGANRDNNYGGGGGYNRNGGRGGYRGGYDGSRGGGYDGSRGGRPRNNGSYYSRKMMHYNDLDAPNDE